MPKLLEQSSQYAFGLSDSATYFCSIRSTLYNSESGTNSGLGLSSSSPSDRFRSAHVTTRPRRKDAALADASFMDLSGPKNFGIESKVVRTEETILQKNGTRRSKTLSGLEPAELESEVVRRKEKLLQSRTHRSWTPAGLKTAGLKTEVVQKSTLRKMCSSAFSHAVQPAMVQRLSNPIPSTLKKRSDERQRI